MRVLADLDPVRLEQALLEAIESAHPAAADSRTLVLVPTARLAAHLQLRLARRRRAWTGVEVRHFHGLALDIVNPRSAAVFRPLSPRLLRAVLREVVAGLASPMWSSFLARRPGALRQLAASLTDLREAAVAPAEFEALEADDHRGRELGRIYAAFEARLAGLARRGWLDEVGVVRRATTAAATFAGRYPTLFLYGAYDLNGIQRDLVRALDDRGRLVAFVPGDASAAAARFACRVAFVDPQRFESVDTEPPGPRPALRALFAEESRPAPAPSAFAFRHAQGAEAEVRVALGSALREVADGCPPREIALVARNLRAYASAIEQVFHELGVPWSSTLNCPLRRQPHVRDFLLLLRSASADFPRRSTAELLDSPRIDWSRALPGVPAPPTGVADAWSRQARIIGGFEEWTVDLGRWLERAGRNARKAHDLAATLAALREALAPQTRRSFGEHAVRLRALLERLFLPAGHRTALDAMTRLGELIEEMGLLDALLPGREAVPFSAACDWIEQAVDETELAIQAGDEGGIQVLDLMQARGQTFEHVHLLGLNSGNFPAAPVTDPFLTDATRARLREQSGRPLALKAWFAGEERLLLALALGLARRRTELSWQRADETGRSRTPSLFLREAARLALGVPDLDRLIAEAEHVPSHPAQLLQALARDPGLITPDEGLLLAALRDGTELVDDSAPEIFTDGIRMLRETQSFRSGDPAFDGRIGPRPDSGRAISVSALERLGQCPLQFFFQHVLRVRELELEQNPLELSAHELGQQVHVVLQQLYVALHEQGLLRAAAVDQAVESAREFISRSRLLGDVEQRFSRRLPVLWRQVRARWQAAVEQFVEDDLRRLADQEWQMEAFEMQRTVELDLGAGVRRTVVGRLDRLLVREGALRVGDYKTGKLGNRVNPLYMLRGRTLQVPLYQKLAGASAEVELLPVGPTFVSPQISRFVGFATPEQQRGFDETLRVLLQLHDGGSFPFRAGEHCRYCAFDAACRRNHPPTQEREQLRPDGRDYANLSNKTLKAPLLGRGKDGA